MNDKINKFAYKPMTRWILVVTILLIVVINTNVLLGMTRIQDIARPLGERSNKLMGMGLVVGLKNGDGGDVLIMARPLFTLLQKMGNPAGSLEELKDAKSVALVWVTGQLGRNGFHNGDKIDITVSTMGKAGSLAGGVLIPIPLGSVNIQDKTVYAWASGPISIPDSEYPTTGIIKDGADVEINFLYDYVDYDEVGRPFFDLVLDRSSFQTARAIAMLIEDINTAPGSVDESYLETDNVEERFALPLGPRTVRVYIPASQMRDSASYIARVMDQFIELPNSEAIIAIDEKAGTIVITANVDISPCVVTVNGLAIRVIEPKPVPNPGQPLVKQSQWTYFDTNTTAERSARIMDLIDALDKLKVPVQEKINAIYALREAGALHARIKIK